MSQLFQSFIFKSKRASIFSKLNPAAVLLFYLFLALADLLTFNFELIIVQLLLSVIIIAAARAPLKFVRLFVIIAAWFGVVLSLATLFFGLTPGKVLYEFTLFGILIRITSGNMNEAVVLFLKLLGLGILTSFYVFIADPRSIVSAMESLKMPYRFSLSMALVFRNLAVFAGDFVIVSQAQKSRGLDINRGSLVQRIKKYVSIVIPLVFLALKRADDLVNALDTKGYEASSGRTKYYTYKFRPADLALMIAGLGLLTFVVIFSFFPGLLFAGLL